jgi:membrane-associated protease RseP (regulator of RpoE activity)
LSEAGSGRVASGPAAVRRRPGGGDVSATGNEINPERATSLRPPARPPDGGSDLLAALARLGVVVLALVAVAIVFHAVGVVVVVVALVAMVMLHELGHFGTAKWSGMKVTEYFFGFGPRLWSVRRGETTYGVKAIPAGGYVKIVGMTMLEDVDEEDEPRSFRQATFPKRVLVAGAGSMVHFLLAFVLLWSVLVFSGAYVPSAPEVSSLLSFDHVPAPAQVAGFRPGDTFVSIDGHQTPTYAALTAIIATSAGKQLNVVVRRRGRLVHLVVTPTSRPYSTCSGGVLHQHSKGEIGVDLSTSKQVTYGPFPSIPRASTLFGSLVGATFSGLGQLFSWHGLRSFGHEVATAGDNSNSSAPACSGAGSGASSSGGSTSGGSSSGQIISFLGAIQLGSQLYSHGLASLLGFLALINIFVGIVNLLPMLPLDGGHVAIAVYERVRSRKGRRYHADITKLLPFTYVFLAFIVIIGLGALYSNILQPVHLPGG